MYCIKLIIGFALFFTGACFAQRSSCADVDLAVGLSNADQFLINGGSGANSNAIRCVLEAREGALSSKRTLTLSEHFRIANIASIAVEQLGGADNVGATEEWNTIIANLWASFLSDFGERIEINQRIRATTMLLVHGRSADTDTHLERALHSMLLIGRRIPTDFPLLIYSTLYRCPNWSKAQKNNDFLPAEVPCLMQCNMSAKLIKENVEKLVASAQFPAKSALQKQFVQQNSLLASRLACVH